MRWLRRRPRCACRVSMNSGRARLVVGLVALLSCGDLHAQTRRAPARRAPVAPPPPAMRTEAAVVKCPQVLGDGVRTKRSYCDVLVGRDPASGILITIPAHSGPATLLFDLHNRHTYSEEEVKASRAFHRFTATIGVLTLDNTLLSRAVVQGEFRTQADLVDRLLGGSGPGGLKAVAPTGTESIALLVAEDVTQVSILGEKLSVIRADGITDTFTASGRPMAIVSNIMVEYRPVPLRAPAARPR
jgi:hypothetical protein